MPIQTSRVITETDGNLALDPAGTGEVILVDQAGNGEQPMAVDGSGTVKTLDTSALEQLPNQTTSSDLVMIQREGVQYYVDATQLGGSSTANPNPGDVTAVPPFLGGDGTKDNPYICTPSIVDTPGGSASTEQLITIANQPAGAQGTWIDLGSGNGSRFLQQTAVFNADGVWTGRLEYSDTPDSVIGTIFTGLLKMGSDSVYISWQVTQVANQTVLLPAGSPTASPETVDYALDNKYGLVSGAFADAAGTLTATGAARFLIDGAGPLTSGDIADGQLLGVQFDAATVDSTANGDVVTGQITTPNGFLLAPTIIVSRNADAFTIPAVAGQPVSSVVTSSNVVVTGINCKSFITLGATTLTSVQASVNGAAYAAIPASGETMPMNPGDTLTIRGTTGASVGLTYTATVNIGTTGSTWSVSTVGDAVTPEVSQPSIVSPISGSSGLEPPLTVTSTAYQPQNGAGAHASSDWQVYQADAGGLSSDVITGISINGSGQTVLNVNSNEKLGQFSPGLAVTQNSGGAPITSLVSSITTEAGGWNIGSGVGNRWVAYNENTGIFSMCGGDSGDAQIGTSTDGKTFFTSPNPVPSKKWGTFYPFDVMSVAMGDDGTGICVIYENASHEPGGYYRTSDGGINWRWSYSETFGTWVIYGNGTYVIGDKTRIRYSTDSLNWSNTSIAGLDSNGTQTAKWIGDRFIVGTVDGFSQSFNGASWSRVILGKPCAGVATDGSGTWVAVARKNSEIYVSTNNQGNWVESNINFPSGSRDKDNLDVAYGNGAFVISKNDTAIPFYVSSDPTSLWVPVNLSGNVISTTIDILLFGEGVFCGISPYGTSPVWSTTGGLDFTDLTLLNDTNLANLKVGDIVTQTNGTATGEIYAIGASSLKLLTSDTFGTSATVTGPEIPAATGVISFANTGNNTITLDNVTGRFLITESDYDASSKLNKTLTAPSLPGSGPGVPTSEPPDPTLYTQVLNSVGDTSNLVSYNLTDAQLDPTKAYYTRVRYNSNDGVPAVSPYSAYNEFLTDSEFTP